MYSIIIPTYGEKGVSLTRDCLDSLKCLQYEHEIIVVDDGSETEVVDRLVEVCDIQGVALFHNEENEGFARTCNAGMAESNGDVVILLNNDIKLLGPSLDMLANAVVASASGIMGIRLLYPNYTIQHAGVWFDPNRSCFDHYFRHGPRYTPGATILKPRLVTGACMAIHRHVIDAIGFLDENFGMAVEDIDYQLTTKEAGFTVIYNGYLEALHLEGATRGNTPDTISPEHLYREQMGLQYLFEKWHGLDFLQFTRERQG